MAFARSTGSVGLPASADPLSFVIHAQEEWAIAREC